MVNTRQSKGKVKVQGQEAGLSRGCNRGRGRGRPARTESAGQPQRSTSSVSSSAYREGSPSHIHETMYDALSKTPIPNTPTPPITPSLLDLVTMLAQAVAQAVAQALTTAQAQHGDKEMIIERAWKLGATEFYGTTDPLQAKGWFQKIEEVFALMNCTEEQKLQNATFLLEGRALQWWKSYTDRQPTGRRVTWADFKREFDKQYFSTVYQDRKWREFLDLKQGNMTVVEYEAKFTELSQFASHLVSNERAKYKLFQDGLRLEIRARTIMHPYETFAELVEGALKAEEIENAFFNRRQERAKRSAAETFMNEGEGPPMKKPNRKTFPSQRQIPSEILGTGSVAPSSLASRRFGLVVPSTGSSVGGIGGGQGGANREVSRQVPQCPTCKKFHFGECRHGFRGCYRCGQLGHLKRDCPMLTQGSGGSSKLNIQQGTQARTEGTQTGRLGTSTSKVEGISNKLRGEARVYAMTRQEAQASPEVVTGKEPQSEEAMDRANTARVL